MNLKIDFDDLAFRAAMNQAVTKLNAVPSELIREEVGLFIKEYRRRTPPMAAYGKPENKGDKQIGEKAIIKDIGHVAITLDTDPNLMPPRLRQLVEKNDEAGIQAYLNNVKSTGLHNRQFLPTIAALEKAHLAARNRYGRVKAKLKNAVTTAVRSEYIKRLMAELGHNKGTFNAASLRVGEKTPAWIRKVGPLGTYTESGDNLDFVATITGRSTVPQAMTHVRQALVLRGKKLTAEVRRIAQTFARTGKIVTRRKSFNT